MIHGTSWARQAFALIILRNLFTESVNTKQLSLYSMIGTIDGLIGISGAVM